jgi:ankyrin repeat protein
MNGREAVLQLLVESGVDVNTQTRDGLTALIVASKYRHEAAVRLLVESGADVNAQASDGSTALQKAERWGQAAVVQLLKSHQREKQSVGMAELE